MIGRSIPNSFDKLLVFLDELERASISYRLAYVRDSSMVLVTVPGQRWEVEFFEDGHVEVERFISVGIEDEAILSELFREDEEPPSERV